TRRTAPSRRTGPAIRASRQRPRPDSGPAVLPSSRAGTERPRAGPGGSSPVGPRGGWTRSQRRGRTGSRPASKCPNGDPTSRFRHETPRATLWPDLGQLRSDEATGYIGLLIGHPMTRNRMHQSLTRRQLLKRAGTAAAATAGLGLVGCGTGNANERKRLDKRLQHFVSRPDLTPPKVWLRHAAPDHELQYLFLGIANSGPGQGGAMIMDTTGELVWFAPDT